MVADIWKKKQALTASAPLVYARACRGGSVLVGMTGTDVRSGENFFIIRSQLPWFYVQPTYSYLWMYPFISSLNAEMRTNAHDGVLLSGTACPVPHTWINHCRRQGG